MGIYYAAVDNEKGKYFEPPESYNNKIPGLYNPNNPFSCMLVMMNCQGWNFSIENDASYDCYYDKDYENITKEVYKEFLEKFPWFPERGIQNGH